LGRDFARLGANVTIMPKQNFMLQLSGSAEVGRDKYQAYTVSAGLRWEF
jgi:outer membrane autotransporter protein